MHKMIHGNVNSDGTKKTGYDFEVQKVNTGIYSITFRVPFPTVPTLLVTQNFPAQNYPGWDGFNENGGNTKDNAVVIAVSEERAKIKTGDHNGNADDRNFSFLAICEIPT